MAFVVDASVAACWLMPDELHPVATMAYERLETEDTVVPWIWWFEVRNILVVNERRRPLEPAMSDQALALLRRHPITLDQSPDEGQVMSLARRHRLSVYDAAYLELALRLRLPLATLESALGEASRAEGAPALGN